MLKKISSICLTILLSSCSVLGINSTPQPKYYNIEEDKPFSIREYEPRLVAEVTIESDDYKSATNKGFRELFNYISGANTTNKNIPMTAPVIAAKSEKIPMTAPVLVNNYDNKWTVAFVMPASMTIDNAPKPTNSNIKISQIPKGKFAVISFSGRITQESIQTNTNKLKKWISNKNIQINDTPEVAGYNPPWTLPFLRTNEIIISIK